MNATQLLAHFDRISEAPDAVARLRRFIFDLAVRGKLVGQLSDIPPEMAPPSSKVAKNECSYEIPASWIWSHVGDVAECRLGKMLDKAKNRGTPQRYLRNVNVRWFDFDLTDVFEMPFEESEFDEFTLRRGDVLVCEGGEPGRAAVWDEREANIYFQKAIHRVRFSSLVEPQFFVIVLRSSADNGTLAKYFTGVGIKHLTGKGLDSFEFPLPPRAEQRRIVAKVDELMALCDRLEAAQAERETRRDRLVAASLNRLNQPSIDEPIFRAHVCFHLRHLPHLSTRTEHVQQLRHTILNLAVRGRLVRQDSSDEPAPQLLARIQSETANASYGASNKRKRQGETVIDSEPFEIPKTWVWTRLGTICSFITDGAHHTPQYQDTGVPFLSVKDVSSGTIDFSNTRFISESTHRELCRRALPEFGDILLTKVGTTGIAVTVDVNREFSIFVSLALLKFSQTSLDRFYLRLLINSPFVRQQSADNTQGIGNKNLVLRLIRQFIIPLPPLAEQHRIVVKVIELMTLCDQLEATLTSTLIESRRLLEAVLHTALASAH